MRAELDAGSEALRQRIAALEGLLLESEETLDAIRRGEIDALVVGGQEKQIYTLESADRPYRVLIEQIQEGALTLNEQGMVLYCNRRLAAMLEVPQERLIGQQLQHHVLPKDLQSYKLFLEDAKRDAARREFVLCTGSGKYLSVYISLSLLLRDSGGSLLCGVLTDLTKQKQNLRDLAAVNTRLLEEISERERVEDALRQSQKMEAVGQLTGGLAHDFNNLLTGISGSLELLQTRVAQGRINDIERYVTAAQGAANRAASLTHRLLAFSRRQTLAPKPTDVAHLVAGMEELIRRTVGPQIIVEVRAGTDLWNTLVDPNQLENALLNLCINARDAMHESGKVTIVAENKVLEEDAAQKMEVAPGDYVCLSVRDTGCGMTAEVMRRAFDPFFTTKPIGEGTGLGLSMIYGFVRQSGGQVQIHSTPGQGTLVCLYLARHAGEAKIEGATPAFGLARSATQGETVLVVDDEETVRMLVCEVLDELGYTAIEAVDGAAGLKILQSDVRIDLLVTDVGLPGNLNGRQVADAGRAIRPGLKVLFITGYAASTVLGNGQMEEGMAVLTKPFAMQALGSRIKDLIAAR